MSAQNTSVRVSSAQVMGAKARAYEIAQLRAQRVARRSAEVASGQRRMALAGVLVGLFVVLLSGAAFAVVSWLWTLVPVAGLVAVLAVSRRAAVAAARADREDRQRLVELKSQSRSVHYSGEGSSTRSDVVTDSLANAERDGDVSGLVGVQFEQREDSVLVTDGLSVRTVSESVKDQEAPSETAEEKAVVEQGVPVEKAWTPTPLPVSRYSQGARVEGRVVHADTDLRGIPRVKASVPARPIAATVDADARSTDEVARSVPLAFDLDEILEARRA